jgi:hypothetical protein
LALLTVFPPEICDSNANPVRIFSVRHEFWVLKVSAKRNYLCENQSVNQCWRGRPTPRHLVHSLLVLQKDGWPPSGIAHPTGAILAMQVAHNGQLNQRGGDEGDAAEDPHVHGHHVADNQRLMIGIFKLPYLLNILLPDSGQRLENVAVLEGDAHQGGHGQGDAGGQTARVQEEWDPTHGHSLLKVEKNRYLNAFCKRISPFGRESTFGRGRRRIGGSERS